MDRIDPALMRPGRLLTHREFTRLSPEDAKAVAATSGVELADQDDYSLAELYRPFTLEQAAPSSAVLGFAR